MAHAAARSFVMGNQALIFTFGAAPAGHGVHRSFFARGRFTRRREGAEDMSVHNPEAAPRQFCSALPRLRVGQIRCSPLGMGSIVAFLACVTLFSHRRACARFGPVAPSSGYLRLAWGPSLGSRKSEVGRPSAPHQSPPGRRSAALLSSGLSAGHGVHSSLFGSTTSSSGAHRRTRLPRATARPTVRPAAPRGR